MQFESMLFKGQLYFGTIGFNQPMITPDHCTFIEMDSFILCPLETDSDTENCLQKVYRGVFLEVSL